MRKFILTHEKFEGEIELTYDGDGTVTQYISRSDVTVQQVEFMLRNLPVKADSLKVWAEGHAFAVVEIKGEPTFEEFWKLWPEVRANKARALAIWKRLSVKDRQRVIDVMPAYTRYVQRNLTKFKKYPDSWLSERCFENDYNKM